MWVQFKLKHFVLNLYINGRRGRNTFLGFCDSNETLIFMANLVWKIFLKLIMNLFSKERKDTSFHSMSQKESFNILGFFETNRSVGAKPLKRRANIIADSETFKRYRDFDTWVGRWSNWNGGVIIFSDYLLTNVVITGYLSYGLKWYKSIQEKQKIVRFYWISFYISITFNQKALLVGSL